MWVLVRYASLLGALLVVACTETKYVPYDQAQTGPEFPYRTVAFEIDREFYNNFPSCVLIMPPMAPEGIEKLPLIVETAIGRHLTEKFSRVIVPVERSIAVRRMAIDLTHPDDRKVLAKHLGCDTFVFTDLVDPKPTFLIVWSQIRLGIKLRMIRVGDDRVLWRAQHFANRSEGGIPLSPLGFLADSFSSTRFAADREIAESVVDDAIRRLVAPLPNVRDFNRRR